MSDYLSNLATRSVSGPELLQPLMPSRFEPAPALVRANTLQPTTSDWSEQPPRDEVPSEPLFAPRIPPTPPAARFAVEPPATAAPAARSPQDAALEEQTGPQLTQLAPPPALPGLALATGGQRPTYATAPRLDEAQVEPPSSRAGSHRPPAEALAPSGKSSHLPDDEGRKTKDEDAQRSVFASRGWPVVAERGQDFREAVLAPTQSRPALEPAARPHAAVSVSRAAPEYTLQPAAPPAAPRSDGSIVEPSARLEPAQQRPPPASLKIRSPEPTPTIQVTIGRIDVRATPAAAAPSSRGRAAPPSLSLDDYLDQRNRRGQ